PDYVENLFRLMELAGNTEGAAKFRNDYAEASIRYGDLKKQLAEDMVAFVKPIREKATSILQNEEQLRHVVEKGTEKARENAQITIDAVRKAMGLNYFG